MRLSNILFAAAAVTAANVKRYLDGPEIWGSYNEIVDCDMQQAIECLHKQICERRLVPWQGRIRCTIGASVAYFWYSPSPTLFTSAKHPNPPQQLQKHHEPPQRARKRQRLQRVRDVRSLAADPHRQSLANGLVVLAATGQDIRL